MELRVLGCSGGFGAGLRTSSFLLNDGVLLDAGTGAGELPIEALRSIRHVFLTHAHLDHVCSLPLLVDTLFEHLHEPLVVHARPETIEAVRAHVFNGEVWPDFTLLPNPERPVLRFEPLEPGEQRSVAGLTIESIPVAHSVPAVGYLCSDGAASLCYSGDTTSNETLWSALNRHPPVGLLVVEAGFPDRDRALAETSRHYCPELLARDLEKLQSDPPIGITHLRAGEEARTMRELEAALPGRRLTRLQSGDRFQL